MIKEFKEFASLVDDIIMPPIGYLLGSVDFSNMFFVIKEGTPSLPYNTPADGCKSSSGPEVTLLTEIRDLLKK